MSVSMKPNFKDPLDLIKNQNCTSEDVKGWLRDAVVESRKARDDEDQLSANAWSEAIDRLTDQYELMTHGKT